MATAINEHNAGEIIDVAIRLFNLKAPKSADHAFEISHWVVMALERSSELAMKAFVNMGLHFARMRYEGRPISDTLKAYMRDGYDRLEIDNADGCSMLGCLTHLCSLESECI